MKVRGARRVPTASSLPPEALILGAALSVQVGASVATGLLRQYSPIAVVALRLLFGAIVLLAFRRPKLATVRPGGWWSVLALGGVFLAMNSAFYLAISRIPLGVAVTIEFWGPLAVAVLGSRRPRDLLWAVLAAAGIYTLAGGTVEATDMLGIAAAFVAGGGWLLYILVGARMGRDWPDGRGLTVGLVIGAALTVPLGFIFGDLGTLVTTPGDLWLVFIVAVFSSALPWSLEMVALTRMRSGTYSVLMSLEPAIAALVGFALLAQVLSTAEVGAIALVALASAGASLTARSLTTVPGELEGA